MNPSPRPFFTPGNPWRFTTDTAKAAGSSTSPAKRRAARRNGKLRKRRDWPDLQVARRAAPRDGGGLPPVESLPEAAASGRMTAVPLTLRDANAIVALWHRHHKPSLGHKFSIGAMRDGRLVGAVIVGRPVARAVDWRRVAEVSRLATDGTRDACSFLYARAADAVRAMGYALIQTYILAEEHGSSLKASGYAKASDVPGRPWAHTAGPRRHDQPEGPKTRWERALSTGPRKNGRERTGTGEAPAPPSPYESPG